jgi:uncharacterized protein (DUF4415 family)
MAQDWAGGKAPGRIIPEKGNDGLAFREKQLTIRIDADVLAWFRAQGRGYQTRINRILRVVMESQPPTPFGENRSTKSRT